MKTLVAGIGNVFLGDDGFGVEVAARLSREQFGESVRILDTGIRARHLAYELLDGGYHTAILVDAVARGGAPGTVYLIEPEPATDAHAITPLMGDGHGVDPGSVLDFLRRLGGTSTRILVVGCEPEQVDEGIGLSPRVAAAVDEAVALVRDLVCA